jgi:hypothetical protein
MTEWGPGKIDIDAVFPEGEGVAHEIEERLAPTCVLKP